MSKNGLVFVGTYSEPILFGTGQVVQGKGKGIYAFRLDAASGALAPIGVTEGVRNSSYLAFDPSRRFLYCVNEFKEFEGTASGAVSAFRIDAESGKLTFLNMKASHGTDPCHLIVDKTGKNLLIANFASGSVCVLPIAPDGSLKDASEVIQHRGSSVDPKRQAGPHAHAVEIDAANRYVFVAELGLDKVMIYELDAERGKLTPNKNQPLGQRRPRRRSASARHASERQVRLRDQRAELDDVGLWLRPGEGHADGAADALDAAQGFHRARAAAPKCRSRPRENSSTAPIAGTTASSSMRSTRRMERLTLVGHESTRGKTPRNFEVSPTGEFLAAANQDSDNVVMFRIDAKTGKLTPTGNVVPAGTPICVRFM